MGPLRFSKCEVKVTFTRPFQLERSFYCDLQKVAFTVIMHSQMKYISLSQS